MRPRTIVVSLALAACGGDEPSESSGEGGTPGDGSVDEGRSGADVGGVPQCEPLPNRCEQACKDANAAALESCDVQGWVLSLPPDVATALMQCIPACDSDSTDDPTCVGMGSAQDCGCQEQCYADNLDAAQLATAVAVADCYDAAVAAACG